MIRSFFFAIVLFFSFFSLVQAQTYTWPLEITASGTQVQLSGKLDTTKYSTEELQHIQLLLYVAKTPFLETGAPGYEDPSKKSDLVGGGTFLAHTDNTIGSPAGVAADGTYYFLEIGKNNSLIPGQIYYYAQKLTTGTTTEVRAHKFDSSKGNLTPEQEVAKQEDHSYRLLAPWPGFSLLLDPKICLEKLAEKGNTIEAQQELHCSPEDPSGFNYMLNYIFKLLIGVAAVVLVLRLMYEGYVYVVTDVPFLKMSAKSGIFTAFFGLVLALSAYLILNTINPKLVSNSLSLEGVSITIRPLVVIDSATFTSLTGKTILAPEEYLKKVQQYTSGNKTLQCLMIAAINNESAWKPNVIGCDECAADQNGNKVKSRRVFIASGFKLDGTALPSGASATDGNPYNPRVFKAGEPGYGLDWRFSKGMGLTQFTVFPEGYNGTESAYIASVKPGGSLYINRQHPENIRQDGSSATVMDFIKKNMDPDTNIQAGTTRMQYFYTQCGGSIDQTFNAYNTGSCKGNAIDTAARVRDYNSCQQGNIQLKKN